MIGFAAMTSTAVSSECAFEMHELLLEMHAAASEWRQRGVPCIPAIEREEWVV
jgi:hypothetical protein